MFRKFKNFRKYWSQVVRNTAWSFGEIQLTMFEKYREKKWTGFFVTEEELRILVVGWKALVFKYKFYFPLAGAVYRRGEESWAGCHCLPQLPLVSRPPAPLLSPRCVWFLTSPEEAGIYLHKLHSVKWWLHSRRIASFFRHLTSSPSPTHEMMNNLCITTETEAYVVIIWLQYWWEEHGPGWASYGFISGATLTSTIRLFQRVRLSYTISYVLFGRGVA